MREQRGGRREGLLLALDDDLDRPFKLIGGMGSSSDPPGPLCDEGGVLGGCEILSCQSTSNEHAIAWHSRGADIWLTEFADGCDLHGCQARIRLPSPLAEQRSLRAFAWGESGVALCMLTSSGQCFRIVLCRAHPEASALGSLQGGGRLDLGKIPHSESHWVFEGQETWDVEATNSPSFWASSDLLGVGAPDGRLLLLHMSSEHHPGKAVSRMWINCAGGESSMMGMLRAAVRWRPVGGGLLAAVAWTCAGEMSPIALTLGTEWRLRAWSTETGSVLGSLDVQPYLDPQLLMHSSSSCPASGPLTAVFQPVSDPKDPALAYCVVTLQCADASPTYNVVSLRFSSAGVEISVVGEMRAPNRSYLVSGHIQPETDIIWALWGKVPASGGPLSPDLTHNGHFDCSGPSSITTESLRAIVEDESSPVIIHCDRGMAEQGASGSDSALDIYVSDTGGWVSELLGHSLRACICRLEGFYMNRIFKHGRFGPGCVARALDSKGIKTAAIIASELERQQQVLAAVRQWIGEPMRIVINTLTRQAERYSLQEQEHIIQALELIHSSWAEVLAACRKEASRSLRPLSIALLGGTPLVTRVGSASLLLPVPQPAKQPTRLLIQLSGAADTCGQLLAPLHVLDYMIQGKIVSSLGGLVRSPHPAVPDLSLWLRQQFDSGAATFLAGSPMATGVIAQAVEALCSSPDPCSDLTVFVEGLGPRVLPNAGPMDGPQGGRKQSAHIVRSASDVAAGAILERYCHARNCALLLAVLDRASPGGLFSSGALDHIRSFALPHSLSNVCWYATLLATIQALPEFGGSWSSTRRPTTDGIPSFQLLLKSHHNQTSSTLSSSSMDLTCLEALLVTKTLCAAIDELPRLACRLCESAEFLSFLEVCGLHKQLLRCLGVQLLKPLSRSERLEHGNIAKLKRRVLLQSIGESYASDALAAKSGDSVAHLYEMSSHWLLSAVPRIPPDTVGSNESSRALLSELLRTAEARQALTGAELSLFDSYCSSLPPEYEGVWSRLARWPPLAPLISSICSAGTPERIRDLMLSLSGLSEVWQLSQVEHFMKALGLMERGRGSAGFPHQVVLTLAYEALASLPSSPATLRNLLQSQEATLWSSIFMHAIDMRSYSEAFAALTSNPDPARKKDNTAVLVRTLCDAGELNMLCDLPSFVCPSSGWVMSSEIATILERLANSMLIAAIVEEGQTYYDCLYCYHLSKGFYREAATAQHMLAVRLAHEVSLMTLGALRHQRRAELLTMSSLRLLPPKQRYLVISAVVVTWEELCAQAALTRACIAISEIRAGIVPGEYSGSLHGDPNGILGTSASAEDALRMLCNHGLFHAAMDLASEVWAVDRPKLRDMLAFVAEVLGAACRKAEYTGHNLSIPAQPLFLPYGSAGLTRPALVGANRTTGTELQEAWAALQDMLFTLDDPAMNFALHTAAAAGIMGAAPPAALPTWLVDSFCGMRNQSEGLMRAPWAAFACHSAHPTPLIRLYIHHGRLEEACRLVCRLLGGQGDPVTSRSETSDLLELLPEDKGGTDWLPYATLDALFAACELALQEGGSGMEKVKTEMDGAVHALQEFFRFQSFASEALVANRAIRD